MKNAENTNAAKATKATNNTKSTKTAEEGRGRRLKSPWKRLLPRTILTIFFTFIVVLIISITMLLVGLIMWALIHTGIFNEEFFETFQFMPFLIFGLASVIVGTLVTSIVSSIPLKPVNVLIEGMDELANGNYDHRITLGNNRVGHRLSKSFNRMAEELNQTEQLRSDFINNFAHEIKTPMVSIRGFAKLLQTGKLSAEKEKEYLAIIVDEITRLADLSTNALNLTKIENQTILTNVTSFNLSEQMRNSILLLEQKWTNKDLIMMPEFDEHIIEANEELLKQLWINLLDNAIKFAPEKSEVLITIQPLNQKLIIKIQNRGPQILEENLDKLFNKYWQEDRSKMSEGSGIGLSIAKEVVNLHKGQISVDSQAERTIFIVELPQVNKLSQEM